MTINLNPETERLILEVLESGYFHSVDEIIIHGVRARRENEQPTEWHRTRPGRRAGAGLRKTPGNTS